MYRGYEEDDVTYFDKDREMLLTIQGKDILECEEDNDSVDEEVLPPPGLNNLSNIGEEFSTTSLYFPRKRMKLTEYCLKDNVNLVKQSSANT